MRIEQPWFLGAAAAIVVQILILAASPYALAQPWHTLWRLPFGEAPRPGAARSQNPRG